MRHIRRRERTPVTVRHAARPAEDDPSATPEDSRKPIIQAKSGAQRCPNDTLAHALDRLFALAIEKRLRP